MDWICNSAASLGVVFAALTLLGSAIKHFSDRKDLLRQRNFENYHKLVDELVDGRASQQVMKLDSQIAVVFELRNYPKYKEATVRILKGLIVGWGANPSNERLLEEVRLTLHHFGEEAK